MPYRPLVVALCLWLSLLAAVEDAASPAWPPLLRGPITALAVDEAGNRYVVGEFVGSKDFDPQAGAIDVKSVPGEHSGYDAAAFVTSLDAEGRYRWTQIVVGSRDVRAAAVTVIGSTVYVAGDSSSTNIGIGARGLAGRIGNLDAFVAALDARTGAALASFGIAGLQQLGSSDRVAVYSIAVADGTIYLAGSFSGNDLGIGARGILDSVGGSDGLVAALDARSGAPSVAFGTMGVQGIGGQLADAAMCIAAADGTVAIGGQFTSADLGIGGLGGLAADNRDGFLALVDGTDGSARTSFGDSGLQRIGSSGDDAVLGIAIDAGVLLATGHFTGPDLGIAVAGSLAAADAAGDAYVASLDAVTGVASSGFGNNGLVRIGGSAADMATGIACHDQKIYTAGYFRGEGFGIGAATSWDSAGETDGWVGCLARDGGAPISSFGLDGVQTIGCAGNDTVVAVAVAGSDLLLAGSLGPFPGGVGGAPDWDGSIFWPGLLCALDPASGVHSRWRLDLALEPLGQRILGDAPFIPAHRTNPVAGTAVQWHSSQPQVAAVDDDGRITLHGVGFTTVSLQQDGGHGHPSTTVSQGLHVLADGISRHAPLLQQGTCSDIATDATGNRYLIGTCQGRIDFDPRPDRVRILDTYTGYILHSGAYVTRINADGTYAWTRLLRGSHSAHGISIAVADDVVYAAGYFSGTGFGVDGRGAIDAVDTYQDGFVVALSTVNGDPVPGFGSQGAQRLGGGSRHDSIEAITVSGERLYLVGDYHSATLAIGAGPGIAGPDNASHTDGFVACLDAETGLGDSAFGSSGLVRISGALGDTARTVAVADGLLAVAGSTASADLGIGTRGTFSSSGGLDVFVALLNADLGTPVSAFGTSGLQRIGGSAGDTVDAISLGDGLLHVLGTTSSSNLGIGGPGGLAASNSDAFVATLQVSDGSALLSFSGDGVLGIGGSSWDNGDDLHRIGETLYAACAYSSRDLRYDDHGTLANIGGTDGVVVALDRRTGALRSDFSGDGLERIGGSRSPSTNSHNDVDWRLAGSQDQLVIAGTILSSNAGVDGPGVWDGTRDGWSALVLPLHAVTAAPTLPPQSLALAAIPPLALGTPPHLVQVTADPRSGSPVELRCADPSIARIEAGTVVPLRVGSTILSAHQAAGNGYAAAEARQSIDVRIDGCAPHHPPQVRSISRFACDAAGNRYVAGVIRPEIWPDFDPRPASADMRRPIVANNTVAYVSRYDADGRYAWTQIIGGHGSISADALAVTDHAIYLSGGFEGERYGIGMPGTLSAPYPGSLYVLALSTQDGRAILGFGNGGMQVIGGNSHKSAAALAVNDTTVALTGSFTHGSIQLAGSTPLVPIGRADAFIACLQRTDGAAIPTFGQAGLLRIGGSSDDNGQAILAADGRWYVGGSFQSSDLGIGSVGTLDAPGSTAGFLAMVDASTGAPVAGFGSAGLRSLGGSTGSAAVASLHRRDGILYACGSFYGDFFSIDTGPGIPSRGGTDAFVAAFNPDTGAVRTDFGSAGTLTAGGSGNDSALCIASGSSLYITGNFSSNDFAIGTGPTLHASAGLNDVFVLAVDPVTGVHRDDFGTGGTVALAGSNSESAIGLHSQADVVWLGATTDSPDTGLGAPGPWNGRTGWSGLVVDIAAADGNHPPMRQQISMDVLPSLLALGVDQPGLVIHPDLRSGNPVSLHVDNPSIARIDNGRLLPLATGTVTVVVTQAAGNGYAAASAGQRVEIIADGNSPSAPLLLRDRIVDVVVDAEGNRYAIGSFARSQDFDPRPGSWDLHRSWGLQDVFISCIAADGTYRWTRTVAGSDSDEPVAIALSGTSVLACGNHRRPVGIGGTELTGSGDRSSSFVVKLDCSTGQPIADFGEAGLLLITYSSFSPSSDQCLGMAVAAGQVVLTGRHLGTTSTPLRIGRAAVPLPPSSRDSSYVILLDGSSGQAVSSFGIGGVRLFATASGVNGGTSTPQDIVLTADRVLVTGSYKGVVLDLAGTGTITSSGSSDAFLAVLDRNTGLGSSAFGSGGWLNLLGSGSESGVALFASPERLYWLGTFASNNLRHPSTSSSIGTRGNKDLFCYALDPATGAPLTSFGVDGVQTIGGSSTDAAVGLAMSDDRLAIIGTFDSRNLLIGNAGESLAAGRGDSLLIALLDPATGAARTGFSADGLERIDGDRDDVGVAISLSPGRIHVAGNIPSDDAYLGTAATEGPWNGAAGWSGLVLDLRDDGLPAEQIDVIDTTSLADGHPHHAPVLTTPDGLAVAITYDGSAEPPSTIGSYAVVATITQTGFSGSATGTLTIVAGPPPADHRRIRVRSQPGHWWLIEPSPASGAIDGDDERFDPLPRNVDQLLTPLPGSSG